MKVAVPSNSRELKSLTFDLFEDRFRHHVGEALPPEARVTRKAGKFRSALVGEIGLSLANGNAYDTSNPANLRPLERMLWVVLRKLPVDKNTLASSVRARLRSDRTGDMRTIEYFLLLDRGSRKFVEIFVIVGTM